MKESIFSGYFGKLHCQGIALDLARGYIYYSFTTMLVKADLDGNVIGTVGNISGHLGCIARSERDGRIYASLEYKRDGIGSGILAALGREGEEMPCGFYIAIFEPDRITEVGMDAETSGVMKTVYLRTVVEDYEGEVTANGVTRPHIYGCSGIDGVTVAPEFGSREGEYLYVAYGIYSDLEREDNDYQVILQYDYRDWWESVAEQHLGRRMHKSGPEEPRRRYFLYTGNTNYGVQNMEYDPYTGDCFLAVYSGKKPTFPNYPMFVIDGGVPARREVLRGSPTGEEGLVLTLRRTALERDGISGVDFRYGSTGFFAVGDGSYYVSEPTVSEAGEQGTNVRRYRLFVEDGYYRFRLAAE